MINTIIFDLGGVLIDWNPKYLYSKIFTDEGEMDAFLSTICTPDWNEEQDAGRSLQEGTNVLVEQFPGHEHNIRAFYSRWHEMLGGVIQGTVDILQSLKQDKKLKLYALTNWSAETFPVALDRYDFLQWFDGIVVSGTEKIRKPSHEFYCLLLQRYNLKPSETLFIDDNLRNIYAAEEVGLNAFHYVSPEQLLLDLKASAVI